MGKILKGAAVAVLVVGMSGSASAATDVFNTGPGSDVAVHRANDVDNRRTNNNNTNLENDNPQVARSGDVRVRRNTTARGDFASGEAVNDSLVNARVMVDNEGCDCDEGIADVVHESPVIVEQTGPESRVRIRSENRVRTQVVNNNNVNLQNRNSQLAESGDVEVSGNTTAGGARSGRAHNVSTVEYEVHINNR